MRTSSFVILAMTVHLWACGGVSAGGSGAAAGDLKALSFSAFGLTVTRPADWTFVAPDATSSKDAVVLVVETPADRRFGASVEIGRRPLSAADRQQPAAEVLALLKTELVETAQGFGGSAAVQETMVAGLPAVRSQFKMTETFLEGGEMERAGRLVALVYRGDVWMIRALGPADGSGDASIDRIVASIALEPN